MLIDPIELDQWVCPQQSMYLSLTAPALLRFAKPFDQVSKCGQLHGSRDPLLLYYPGCSGWLQRGELEVSDILTMIQAQSLQMGIAEELLGVAELLLRFQQGQLPGIHCPL